MLYSMLFIVLVNINAHMDISSLLGIWSQGL